MQTVATVASHLSVDREYASRDDPVRTKGLAVVTAVTVSERNDGVHA
ncbi:hypothetical protein [Halocatena pleomorpha]|nr:hypothetical protein [Halocatena pleomorpha]